MSRRKNIKYSDEPMQIGEEVPNFLPKPEELVFKSPLRKVTITLDQTSIDFFQNQVQKHNISFQEFIQTLLTNYIKRKQK